MRDEAPLEAAAERRASGFGGLEEAGGHGRAACQRERVPQLVSPINVGDWKVTIGASYTDMDAFIGIEVRIQFAMDKCEIDLCPLVRAGRKVFGS